MKVFARKQREALSILPPLTKQSNAGYEANDNAIRDSFHGWLHSTTPVNAQRVANLLPIYRVPRLSALDVSRVNKATIREGESHCVWPPSIVHQFSQADVITDSSIQHYELRDVNLTRVTRKRK